MSDLCYAAFLASEVSLFDRFGLSKLFARAREGDAAGLDYICSVGYRKCHLSILLYEKDRSACLVQVHYDIEDLVYQNRRQSH